MKHFHPDVNWGVEEAFPVCHLVYKVWTAQRYVSEREMEGVTHKRSSPTEPLLKIIISGPGGWADTSTWSFILLKHQWTLNARNISLNACFRMIYMNVLFLLTAWEERRCSAAFTSRTDCVWIIHQNKKNAAGNNRGQVSLVLKKVWLHDILSSLCRKGGAARCKISLRALIVSESFTKIKKMLRVMAKLPTQLTPYVSSINVCKQ